MNIGILGAGKIAHTMAKTIIDLKDEEIKCTAVASRNIKKAEEFAQKYNIEKAYGSYEEMVKDDNLDLIYIATPHSHHHDHAILCINNNKNILCEKSFCANEEQTKDVLNKAKEKGVFITEAIWTRYMPSRNIINDTIKSNIIGQIHSVSANLGYHLKDVERMNEPSLAGGALLDVGIYTINFALMVLGDDNLNKIESNALMSEKGVDLNDNITLYFKGGITANLFATMLTPTDRSGYIYGEKGYIKVTNINNPEKIEVFNEEHEKIKDCIIPKQVSGYEYELIACKNALKNNQKECIDMPHETTIKVMNIMDNIRKQWNMKYPFEK